jgi:hypothetical protein
LNNVISDNRAGIGAGVYCGGDSILLSGNAIDHNTGYADHGGGVYVAGTATITRNTISNNITGQGYGTPYGWAGGVIVTGYAHMSYNIIHDNFAPSRGGGVFVDEGGRIDADHDILYHNGSAEGGGGYLVDGGAGPSSLYLTNCTVYGNYSSTAAAGNGVYLHTDILAVVVKNCIFGGNGGDFAGTTAPTLSYTFTLCQDNQAGSGNIHSNPLFADTVRHDFHLQSAHGRWNPDAQAWVNDVVSSPAIDAGDPADPFSNETPGNGGRINLGAYGNTAEASRTTAGASPNEMAELNGGVFLTAYPNPFKTGISFHLSGISSTDKTPELLIINSLGKLVLALKFDRQSPRDGTAAYSWRAPNLPSGLYFARLKTAGRILSRRLMLIK